MKWAGGKRQLLEELVARVPHDIETYYEPFAGGGALFFALASDPARAPRRAVLNDLNRELVTAYEVVRDRVDALIERLETIEREYLAEDGPGREALYYRTRAVRPRGDVEVAARLIFLNRTCFNGLYRVNRRGGFNVPHGRYREPAIAQPARLRAASKALQGVELLCMDFEEACDGAGPDDFVYFDPPFYPLSNSANFTAYTDEDFSSADQLRLKACIDALTRRGVAVLLSDSAHPWVEGLYRGGGYGLGDGAIELVASRRAINSRGDRRGAIGELLIANYRPPNGRSSNGFRRNGAQLALIDG